MAKSRHILFLVGIPGSGKSTFAKEFVHQHPNYKRVNKDELRFMIHDEDFKTFDKKKEKFVVSVRDCIIRQALNDGYNVIVDDTNIEEKHYASVLKVAQSVANVKDCVINVQVKVFDTPRARCLERNAKREGKACVPASVIEKMSQRLSTSPLRTEKGVILVPLNQKRPYNPDLPTCIVIDMDGTTSLLNGRNPYDAKGCINDLPNEPVVGLIHELQHSTAIIAVSGREDKDKDETLEWVRNHAINLTAAHLRKTGDNRPDDIIKTEIYLEHILPFYNVRFVLDDRDRVVEAIRALGIPVFQVAPGDF